MAIGLGREEMPGADYAFCSFIYTSTVANDYFWCNQRQTSRSTIPSSKPLNYVADVSTNTNYDTNSLLVDLEVTFSRKLNTGEKGDYVIPTNREFNIIAAYSGIASGLP